MSSQVHNQKRSGGLKGGSPEGFFLLLLGVISSPFLKGAGGIYITLSLSKGDLKKPDRMNRIPKISSFFALLRTCRRMILRRTRDPLDHSGGLGFNSDIPYRTIGWGKIPAVHWKYQVNKGEHIHVQTEAT